MGFYVPGSFVKLLERIGSLRLHLHGIWQIRDVNSARSILSQEADLLLYDVRAICADILHSERRRNPALWAH